MNPAFIKAWNDLRMQPGRTLLVTFALIIGLWGVGSVLVSYFILKNDLNENYLRTSPFHLALTSKDFTHLSLEQLLQQPEIESAEFRDLSYQRIEVFPDHWIPLWVFGVEDFNQFQLARVYPQGGAFTPPPGAILLERNGRLVSNLGAGSVANIRRGGKLLHVPVAGIVFDPAQAPATQDAFIYAYTDKTSYHQITDEPVNQRLIVRLKHAESRKQVLESAKILVEQFSLQGIIIDSIDVPTPNSHPHQWQLNTLIAFQSGIGLLALLMGAVLVSQLISAILAGQTRQIGILKAIGAKQRNILGLYLMMVLIPGILASVIAVPLALISGYGYAGFVAKILNFDILTNSLPPHLYLGLFACGLLLPVLFAFPALLRASRIPTHKALSSYGIDANKVSAPVMLRFCWLPFITIVAIRNVLRRRQRLITMVSTIALGVAIFSAGFNVRQSLLDFLNESKASMRYDVQIVLKNSVPRDLAMAPFADIENVRRIETWNGGRGRLQSKVSATGNGIGIVALPFDTDLEIKTIIQGRWLGPSDQPEIVMNQKAAENFGEPIELGRQYRIDLGKTSVSAKLVGITKEFDVAKIYIDKTTYDNLVNPKHLINSILFVAKDRDYEQVVQLKQEIERRAAKSDLNIFYVMSQAERARIIFDHLNIILMLFTLLSSLVLIIGTLGMAAATSASILERTREIGVMRAVGATPKKVYRLLETESAVVSSLGILLGLLLSLPLSFYASKFFGSLILGHDISLSFAFSQGGFAITILVMLLFGWLASILPSTRALSISTRAALSYE